jgi:hypothetical protein
MLPSFQIPSLEVADDTRSSDFFCSFLHSAENASFFTSLTTIGELQVKTSFMVSSLIKRSAVQAVRLLSRTKHAFGGPRFAALRLCTGTDLKAPYLFRPGVVRSRVGDKVTRKANILPSSTLDGSSKDFQLNITSLDYGRKNLLWNLSIQIQFLLTSFFSSENSVKLLGINSLKGITIYRNVFLGVPMFNVGFYLVYYKYLGGPTVNSPCSTPIHYKYRWFVNGDQLTLLCI